MLISQFLTPLDVRKVGAIDWMLLTDLKYVSVEYNGTITVIAGSVSDFASIPRIAQITFPKSDLYDPAAVIHDKLYTEQLVTRLKADKIFYEACVVCGLGFIKAKIMYHQLRLWGWIAWNKHTKELKLQLNLVK